ncbi:MAG: GNAT family N-acetyltransferase [Candidatus Cloacimonetes bacterium]|nr:GNAT family N-acetyltransferase [Candidatus Cloacimonadota bacterium]
MVQIKKVENGKDLKAFIMLPFSLYQNDPNWVAPLIGDQKKMLSPRHNPFFKHSEACLFLALKCGEVVGRITAHTNLRHNAEHKDNIGFFGFFECENDVEVARALLDAASDWNKAKGRGSMRGPMNFTINDECGMLVDGFDTPPMIMNRHDKPYYQTLLEECGFAKEMDMYAYLSHKTEMPERIDRLAAAIEKRTGVTIRSIRRGKKERAEDIKTIFYVYAKAWESNWGNVPMTQEELEHTTKELLPVADLDLVLLAEMKGEPIGFCLSLPNYNEVLKVMNGRVNPITIIKALFAKRKISTARVITMGVVEGYRGRGIDTLFYYYSYKSGLPKGLHTAEFSWVLENNTMMIRVAEMLDAKVYKTYRMYERNIT